MQSEVHDPLKRVLYHHRTQGKAVEAVHIRGISDALRAEGVEVDVLSLPGADPYVNAAAQAPSGKQKSWMRFVAKLPEPIFELAELSYNLICGWRVWSYLARRPDVDFIYERYSLFMFAPAVVAHLRGLPIILEVNDSAVVHRVRPLFFQRLSLMIERWVFRNASGLVFVSGIFRDRVIVAHGEIAPAIVTPNAANIDKFSFSAEQRAAAREHWNLGDSVVCGYLGAFVHWHGIDQFVHAIADRLADVPDLKLLLVGDGAVYREVKDFIEHQGLQDRIVLTGRVPHDAVPGLLAAMDMAILPSAGDYTSPVKLFEFMACAIPPIAPDYEPIKEVLVHDRNGWMFEAGNMDAAIEQVIERSRDVESLRRVGGTAREYIAAERQWRNNVLQLVDFYRSIRGETARD